MKKKPSLGVLIFSLLLLFGIFNCGGINETEDVELYFPSLDPQVVLSPGILCDPAPNNCLDGSTLIIPGYVTVPMVHSYPAYAGVENPGEVGIGSSAGYDPKDSFTIPINANLGDKTLTHYKFKIIIDRPDLLQLSISGTNPSLPQKYSNQYNEVQGFDSPNINYEDTDGYIYLEDSGTASGRVNLAEFNFTILDTLPKQGINLRFEIEEFTDEQNNDLCPLFGSTDCVIYNGIIINNFRIEKP